MPIISAEVLTAGPHLHAVTFDIGDRGRNLHRRVDEVRRPIGSLDDLGVAGLQRRLDIATLAADVAWGLAGVLHELAVSNRVP
jgi:hypothetical protein